MDYRVIQTSQTYFFVKSLIPLTQHLWDSPPRFPRDHRSEINVTAQWALSLECLCTTLLRVVSWKIIMSAVFCLCYYDVISPPTKGRTDIPFRSRADWKKKIIFYLDQIIYLSGILLSFMLRNLKGIFEKSLHLACFGRHAERDIP